MSGLTKLIALVGDGAAGHSVALGEVVGATLETIARIVDKPAINPETNEPITPAEVLAAIDKARAPFQDVVDLADGELKKLDGVTRDTGE